MVFVVVAALEVEVDIDAFVLIVLFALELLLLLLLLILTVLLLLSNKRIASDLPVVVTIELNATGFTVGTLAHGFAIVVGVVVVEMVGVIISFEGFSSLFMFLVDEEDVVDEAEEEDDEEEESLA